MDEQHSWLILARAQSLHGGSLRKLLRTFKTVENIARADAATLRAHGLGEYAIGRIVAPDECELESHHRWLSEPGNEFISCLSDRYPPLLAEVSDAPIGLFVRGNPSALNLPQLAIVGSRRPTANGCEAAARIAADAVSAGLAVTSGLAIGIDAAAHFGALNAAGVTLGVCATGLDRVYPRTHEELAAAIVERGALVSEFPPGTDARPLHFPRRNRIISGLTLGTLVVEAALKSGSLITARYAAEQGREVFAVPGSIHNPAARGCHQLLKFGATLAESIDDIVAQLGPIAGALQCQMRASSTGRSADNSEGALDKEYKMLLDALGFDPANIDQLIERSGLKPDAVASMLLILELEGRIESLPGALYVRCAGV